MQNHEERDVSSGSQENVSITCIEYRTHGLSVSPTPRGFSWLALSFFGEKRRKERRKSKEKERTCSACGNAEGSCQNQWFQTIHPLLVILDEAFYYRQPISQNLILWLLSHWAPQPPCLVPNIQPPSNDIYPLNYLAWLTFSLDQSQHASPYVNQIRPELSLISIITNSIITIIYFRWQCVNPVNQMTEAEILEVCPILGLEDNWVYGCVLFRYLYLIQVHTHRQFSSTWNRRDFWSTLKSSYPTVPMISLHPRGPHARVHF